MVALGNEHLLRPIGTIPFAQEEFAELTLFSQEDLICIKNEKDILVVLLIVIV